MTRCACTVLIASANSKRSAASRSLAPMVFFSPSVCSLQGTYHRGVSHTHPLTAFPRLNVFSNRCIWLGIYQLLQFHQLFVPYLWLLALLCCRLHMAHTRVALDITFDCP